MNVQASIMHHLRGLDEPCTVQDIAHAIGMLEPGDGVPDAVRSQLTIMVRNQQVKRHHNSDGVLRYSLLAAEVRPTPAPAAPPTTAPVRVQPPHHRYQTGVADRVLAAFERSGVPVPRSALEDRIYPPLTKTQVLTALIALRKKGLVERVGTTAAARWVKLDGPAPPATVGAAAQVDARNDFASDLSVIATRAHLLQARLAIEAALQALEA